MYSLYENMVPINIQNSSIHTYLIILGKFYASNTNSLFTAENNYSKDKRLALSNTWCGIKVPEQYNSFAMHFVGK